MWEPQDFVHFQKAYYGHDFNPSTLTAKKFTPKNQSIFQQWEYTSDSLFNKDYYGTDY